MSKGSLYIPKEDLFEAASKAIRGEMYEVDDVFQTWNGKKWTFKMPIKGKIIVLDYKIKAWPGFNGIKVQLKIYHNEKVFWVEEMVDM